ncbi:DNA repair exonuclease [Levilactobacillus paucivorans]|uniref:DNA repair exonuclease n=1 Tax=Levilactobacillus paucivorans TaxID=616990 RepID=A0A0R2LFR3_9LACO|nr:DNA repair exonuclease [Levilactobacillus paucivorans]KRO00295.1 DNA repair exonuclease [Levilactobacillus paucivorans]
MKFIHAADLHLDSPFLGLQDLPTSLLTQIRESTFNAATRVFDRALAEQVDFVLLAGDLFDRAEQSVAAQAYLIEQFDRLAQAQIPVILGFGNHDFLADQHLSIAYPDNVTVLGPQVTTVTLTLRDGQTVAISGFSYDQRWVAHDPLAAFPKHATTDWHLGMLHGAVAMGSGDHYAPFTVAELLAKRYDYWALGHIHQRQFLNENPPILYAGNTQGRDRTETGERGAYLVTSQDHRLVPKFFATSALVWTNPTLTIAASTPTLAEIGDQLATWLTQAPATTPELVVPTLALAGPLSAADQAQVTSGDWLALFQRTHRRAMQDAQRVVVALRWDSPVATTEKPQLDTRYWTTGADQVFTSENLQDLFGKLAQEPALADWFADPKTAPVLREEATKLLAALAGEEDDHAS